MSQIQDFKAYGAAIESKPRKSLEELSRFNPYLSQVSSQDLKDIMALFLTLIKRNPDDAIFALAHFLSMANFDSSPFFVDVFPLIHEHLQSKYENVAKDALSCFERLVALTQNSETLVKISGDMFNISSGSLPATRRVWANALFELGIIFI